MDVNEGVTEEGSASGDCDGVAGNTTNVTCEQEASHGFFWAGGYGCGCELGVQFHTDRHGASHTHAATASGGAGVGGWRGYAVASRVGIVEDAVEPAECGRGENRKHDDEYCYCRNRAVHLVPSCVGCCMMIQETQKLR